MKKLGLVMLLLVIAFAPMGCRALMIGTEAGYQAVVAVIDPVDSGHYWSDFGDYLKSAGNSTRKNLAAIHKSFDHYFMLHDWDDPTY
jgi:hypothetical protein